MSGVIGMEENSYARKNTDQVTSLLLIIWLTKRPTKKLLGGPFLIYRPKSRSLSLGASLVSIDGSLKGDCSSSGPSNTTVPLTRLKPRTGTPPQTEARRARCVSTDPLSASVDSDWPPSTTVQSAQAARARRNRSVRPRAYLPR